MHAKSNRKDIKEGRYNSLSMHDDKSFIGKAAGSGLGDMVPDMCSPGGVKTSKSRSWGAWAKKHAVLVVFLVCVLIYVATRGIYAQVEKQQNKVNEHVSVLTRCSQEKRNGGQGLDGIDQVVGCPPEVERIVGYCQQHPSRGEEGHLNVHGHENFADASSFKMIHLLMTIRHGDRSAIHDMPNSNMEGEGARKIRDAAARAAVAKIRGADSEMSKTEEGEGEGGGGDGEGAKSRNTKEREQEGTTGLNHPVHGNKYLDVRALERIPSLANFRLQPLIKVLGGGSSWQNVVTPAGAVEVPQDRVEEFLEYVIVRGLICCMFRELLLYSAVVIFHI
jgi:hypothetical protein